MRATIAVLGGGVGGLVAANEVARLVCPAHRVVLVEKSAIHAFAPSFLWLMTGQRRTPEITRDLSRLVRAGVEVVIAQARGIDLASRRIEADGRDIEYDFLVVALGAELAPAAVPGLEQGAHTFYTLAGAERLHATLTDFAGGSVAVVVASLPYKCPGAPHEAAMLLCDHLRRRAPVRNLALHLFTPESQPLPVAGPALGAAVEQMLEAKGIAFHPGHKLTAVDPDAHELRFEGRVPVRYDLLVAIPPHRAPALVRDAGLANEAGWVPVDPRTLATRHERVYAVGDVTAIPIPGRWSPDVPLTLPKAGVFAHGQALTVARRIAAEVSGRESDREFCGEGYCMLEAGGDLAGFASGNFFAQPAPDVRLHRVGRAWHLGKVLFEKWWLTTPGIRRDALGLALGLGGRAYGVPFEL